MLINTNFSRVVFFSGAQEGRFTNWMDMNCTNFCVANCRDLAPEFNYCRLIDSLSGPGALF